MNDCCEFWFAQYYLNVKKRGNEVRMGRDNEKGGWKTNYVNWDQSQVAVILPQQHDCNQELHSKATIVHNLQYFHAVYHHNDQSLF